MQAPFKDRASRVPASFDGHTKSLSRRWMLILLSVLLPGCGGGGGSSQAPQVTANTTPAPDSTADDTNQLATSQVVFTNITDQTGISRSFAIDGVVPRLTDPTRMPILIGGGVAASDYDQDGDIDIYLVAGNDQPNQLFQNQGNNSFVDVAPGLGLDLVHKGSGPAFGDIDGDGDLDLFVGAVEGDAYFLMRNDGEVFVDVTAQSNIIITASDTMSATFSDYDQDGDLDLFLTHWGNPQQPDTENLWRNNGDGTFVSASVESGIAQTIAAERGIDYSFTANFADFDADGDPDLLLASDFKTSKIYRNNGDATFTDITDREVIVDESGMGAAVGDYDNDGDMDWFVSSIYQVIDGEVNNVGNRLYRNDGNSIFVDVTDEAGVADGSWGWGSCMADFDNDGDLDLFHVNGWDDGDDDVNNYRGDQIRFFESQGDGTFIELSDTVGLDDRGQGRGLVCFDSDRDGDLDLLITNNDENHVVFYRNDVETSNHYLDVKLDGTINTAAIGAVITVTGGDQSWRREIRGGNNFASQNPAEAHFGLGAVTSVSVHVLWPDGEETTLTGVASDQLLTVSHP